MRIINNIIINIRFSLFLIIIIPNLIGGALSFSYYYYFDFFPDPIHQIIIPLIILILIVFFCVLLIIRYAIKLKKNFFINGEFKSSEAKISILKLILNIPYFAIFITFLGWFLMSFIIGIYSYFIEHYSIKKAILQAFFTFFLSGSLTIATTYYISDIKIRGIVLKFFSKKDLIQVNNTKKININTRLILSYWVCGIVPILFLFSTQYISLLKKGQDLLIFSSKYNILIGFALIIAVLFSIFSGFHLTRYFGQPLLNLQKGIKEVTKGNFSIVLPVDQKDEIGEVFTGFNNMVSSLKTVVHFCKNIVTSDKVNILEAFICEIKELLHAKTAKIIYIDGQNDFINIISNENENKKIVVFLKPNSSEADIIKSYQKNIFFPIKNHEKVMGFLYLEARGDHFFLQDDLSLLKISFISDLYCSIRSTIA